MRGNPVRKTILYGGVAAIVSGIALLAWAFTTTRGENPWELRSGKVLWAVEGETGDGVGVVALGVVCLGDTRATLFVVPIDLRAHGSNGTPRTVADLGAIDGWTACCAEVGALLGMTMDGYVVLRSEAVDRVRESAAAVGGVGVLAEAADRTLQEISRGAIAADGGDARTAEALGGSRYESGGTSADRHAGALNALLQAARGEAAVSVRRAAREELRRAKSDLSVAERFAVWDELVRASGGVAVAEVPTRQIVHDGQTHRVALAVETEQMVSAFVRGHVTLRAEEITVAVFNGNGLRLAATRAAQYLMDRGFRVSRVANAEAFDYGSSAIVVLTELAKAWMLRDVLPGAASVTMPEEFAPHYDALRAMVPAGTDLMFVVGAGMEFSG